MKRSSEPVAYVDASALGDKLDEIVRLQRLHLKFALETRMASKEVLDQLSDIAHATGAKANAVVSAHHDLRAQLADVTAKLADVTTKLNSLSASTGVDDPIVLAAIAEIKSAADALASISPAA